MMASKTNYVNVSPGRSELFLLLWSSGVMNFANWTHNLILSWLCNMGCGLQHSVYRVQNQGGNNRFHQGFRVEGGQRQKRTSAGGESAAVLRSCREAAWEGVSVFVWKKKKKLPSSWLCWNCVFLFRPLLRAAPHEDPLISRTIVRMDDAEVGIRFEALYLASKGSFTAFR